MSLGIAIWPGSPTLVLSVGAVVELKALERFSDGSSQDRTSEVAWTSSDPAVLSVSNAAGESGKALAASAGNATVSVLHESGATASMTVVVTEAVVTSLAITPAAVSSPAGYGVQFTAVATYSDTAGELPLEVTDLVEWSSSQPSVATISNDPATRGLASGLAPGDATITATIPGDTSATATLTVTAAVLQSIAVEAVGVQGEAIPVGVPVQLRAMGGFSDGTVQDVTPFVEWSTSDAAVATVSNADGSVGVVTGIKVGSATLTATGAEVSGHVTLDFTGAQLQSIALSAKPGRPWTWRGTTTRFDAVGTFDDGAEVSLNRDVVWSVSHPTLAVFSSVPGKENVVYALGATDEKVTITATDPGSGRSRSFDWNRIRARSR